MRHQGPPKSLRHPNRHALKSSLPGGAAGADPAAAGALGGLLTDALGGAGGGAIRCRDEGDEQVTRSRSAPVSTSPEQLGGSGSSSAAS